MVIIDPKVAGMSMLPQTLLTRFYGDGDQCVLARRPELASAVQRVYAKPVPVADSCEYCGVHFPDGREFLLISGAAGVAYDLGRKSGYVYQPRKPASYFGDPDPTLKGVLQLVAEGGCITIRQSMGIDPNAPTAAPTATATPAPAPAASKR